MNVLAISGGRVTAIADGVELPVSNGFRARVHLTDADDYTVERVFTRNGREFDHGTRTAVYCDEVGETAYRASQGLRVQGLGAQGCRACHLARPQPDAVGDQSA